MSLCLRLQAVLTLSKCQRAPPCQRLAKKELHLLSCMNGMPRDIADAMQQAQADPCSLIAICIVHIRSTGS
jgi:hypothetical protein